VNRSTGRPVLLSQRDFRRILLIKPSSLGDIVHALPVLHGLRQRFPNATIDWLVGSAFAPLLEGRRDINELVLFDRRRYARAGRSPRVALEFARFIVDLRGRRYDLALDLQGLLRTGFLAWASGAAVRLGFADAREGAAMFYTHRLRPRRTDMHAVDRNYLSAAVLGFKDVPVTFDLAPDDAAHTAARTLLRDAGTRPNARIIAVVPGARWETKVWPGERFAEAIDALQADPAVQCVLLGGPDEAQVCERIAAACQRPPANLAGRTELRQLAALLQTADVVLCHDSAPMHLAAAFGRPLVCLVGPTNPHRTGPYRRIQDVVRLNLPCAPCYLRKLAHCRHGHECLRGLDVATVLTAVRCRLACLPATAADEGR